jgi:hypothetical protein
MQPERVQYTPSDSVFGIRESRETRPGCGRRDKCKHSDELARLQLGSYNLHHTCLATVQAALADRVRDRDLIANSGDSGGRHLSKSFVFSEES